jgi:hypothetical protein
MADGAIGWRHLFLTSIALRAEPDLRASRDAYATPRHSAAIWESPWDFGTNGED